MSAVPRLLAGPRRALAVLLVALALGEALLAVLFAAGLDRLLAGAQPPLTALLAASGIAAMAAAALMLARWVGEDFAQSFVSDCRAALFEAVTRHPDEGNDARWLTVLINDMAALRHYALRGSVRLWTSSLAAGTAGLWVCAMMPMLRMALIPLVLGALTVLAVVWPLSRAIAAQRGARGRLNRFLVRRVRAELAGEVSAKGHGFKKLAQLSADLGQASVERASSAGAMDAVATLAGLAAALVIVWQSAHGGAGAQGEVGLAGSLTLLGFIAARLLESARALHARIGGRLALVRLAQLLEPETKARPRPIRNPIVRPIFRAPLAWAARLLGGRPALPPPAADAQPAPEECRP
jgi:ABC-type multidrug transport system fused ATPase/permease subunit